MQHVFGLADESSRRIPKIVAHNRLILSARYIQGYGIEIGGLGRPLPVCNSAKVKYVDRYSTEELKSNYPEMEDKEIIGPDIVANGETLDPIPNSSQDFVIANHVIEHFQNPILFLQNACRVLKDDGVLFLAFPNKRKTFDKNRPITEFKHLVDDFTNGPEKSEKDHFEEFVEFAEMDEIGNRGWSTTEEKNKLVQKLMDEDYSIHFHVWDVVAMIDMIQRIRTELAIGLEIETLLSSGDEVIFILRK